MINLRYHVFSLVAVFAALAIGIVVGSTTVRSGLVDNLRGNVERAEERITEVETENDDLVTRAGQLELLEDDGVQLVTDMTPGTPVLWITAPGLEGDVWRGVQRMARAAGAITIGRVAVEQDVVALDAVSDLGRALGSASTDPVELQALLGETLARRLTEAMDAVEHDVPDDAGDADASADGDAAPDATVPENSVPPGDTAPDDTAPDDTAPDDTAPDDTAPDDAAPDDTTVEGPTSGEGDDPAAPTTTVAPPLGPDTAEALGEALGDLEDAGLVDLKDLGAGGLVAGATVQVVVLDDLRSGIDSATVLVPLVDDLTRDTRRIVVLSEARPQRLDDATPSSVVERVRDSGRLSDQMSTVDNLEESTGWIATILAMRNGLDGDLGHYGYRDGSEHLLPQPVQ